MTREDSIRQIENYPPFNEQEEKDKALILGWISNNENAFSRENTVAHITASAWVVNKDRSKVLMVYHNIYNSWSWLGGHADGETDLLSVAIREVKEEAGISNVRMYQWMICWNTASQCLNTGQRMILHHRFGKCLRLNNSKMKKCRSYISNIWYPDRQNT